MLRITDVEARVVVTYPLSVCRETHVVGLVGGVVERVFESCAQCYLWRDDLVERQCCGAQTVAAVVYGRICRVLDQCARRGTVEVTVAVVGYVLGVVGQQLQYRALVVDAPKVVERGRDLTVVGRVIVAGGVEGADHSVVECGARVGRAGAVHVRVVDLSAYAVTGVKFVYRAYAAAEVVAAAPIDAPAVDHCGGIFIGGMLLYIGLSVVVAVPARGI